MGIMNTIVISSHVILVSVIQLCVIKLYVTA